ncbi:MAG: VCBS repeat-containing protein, partial [Acidobacteriota bacterium]
MRIYSFARAAALAALLIAPADVHRAAAADGAAAPSTESSIRFAEVSEAAGARFVHSTRKFRGRPKAEVLEMFTDGGAAVAAVDIDGDGDDDLLLVDSDHDKAHHLLRNDGPDADGALRFTDITAAAGVPMTNDLGSITADALILDYDNDGHRDLLFGRFGTPVLLRNVPREDGSPRVVDVSAAAGLTAFGNTIAVIAFDADRDGFLDLLLGNYFKPVDLLDLQNHVGVLPNNLDDADNGGGVALMRSVADAEAPGGRRFVDVTKSAGLAHHTGWSLDLGHADLDNDGWQDIYIAGDYGTDRLLLNRGPQGDRPVVFDDVTESAVGFDTRKGMNVDMGDYNRDGLLDIYVTNITDEYMKECNMLWHNNGDGTWVDLSRETGTCDTDWGWAAKFADVDNDGWEDLFAVNGLRSAGEENYIPVLLEMILTPDVDFSDVDSYPDIGARTWSGYQPQRFFHNRGDGTFKEMAAAVGLGNRLDGRGVAIADFDRDGRLDIVQTAANQPSLLFHNQSRDVGRWLGLHLVGDPTGAQPSNRDAIGARVTVTLADGTV